jgi:hypothetical protein
MEGVWAELIWLRLETRDELLLTLQDTFAFHKMLRIS